MRPRPVALFFPFKENHYLQSKHWYLLEHKMKLVWDANVAFSNRKPSKTEITSKSWIIPLWRVYPAGVLLGGKSCPRSHQSLSKSRIERSQDPRIPGVQDPRIPGAQDPRIPRIPQELRRPPNPGPPELQDPGPLRTPGPLEPRPADPESPSLLWRENGAWKSRKMKTWCFPIEKMVFFAFRWISWPATLDAVTRKVSKKTRSTTHKIQLIFGNRIGLMCKMSVESWTFEWWEKNEGLSRQISRFRRKFTS